VAKYSVVIPTYNESENISKLIETISSSVDDCKIIVVDDDSPDGTAEIAEDAAEDVEQQVDVIVRYDESGLSSAILRGFNHSDAHYVGVIDADLQHPPQKLNKIISELEDASDIVIGSRYIEGGSIEGWTLQRKLISISAVALAKPILPGVSDPISGFFMLDKSVIDDVDLDVQGYKLITEILVKGDWEQLSEIPYTFRDRENGESNFDKKEILHYLSLMKSLYSYQIRSRVF
jgi:dolichol-phosphate mannosyltransferase